MQPRIWLLLASVLLVDITVFAQQKNTESIEIKGLVNSPLAISLDDLQNFKADSLGDVPIYNHAGVLKSTLHAVKGVPVTSLLEKVTIGVDNPRLLSECYLVFEASDGYKVVFSWNEIFNTKTGCPTYLITSQEGMTAARADNHIAAVTPGDAMTGRRYVKGLARVVVKRVE